MELNRQDVNKIIEAIRHIWNKNEELSKIFRIADEHENSDAIYGISNEYLSEFLETLIGNKVDVVGTVEQLYCCPCCGYKTLTEEYDAVEGTGYDICPLCGWEDDGTKDVNSYRSINRGSIEDYRKRLSTRNISNKWLKSDQ